MAKHEKRDTGEDCGNRPFTQLASMMEKAGMVLRHEAPPGKADSAHPALPEPEPPPEDDDRLFEREMLGVSRISWRPGSVPADAPEPPVFPEPEAEDGRLFQEAVATEAAPPILEHPEYIEGWIGVAGRRFLPGLRSGVYSIQGQIDLHGLTRVEAREAVEEFIRRMSGERSCCVKVVHGRGINSASDKAILKEHLQRWLVTRRMARHVVAYASAPYPDGGVGAIYILLRRMGSRK